MNRSIETFKNPFDLSEKGKEIFEAQQQQDGFNHHHHRPKMQEWHIYEI